MRSEGTLADPAVAAEHQVLVRAMAGADLAAVHAIERATYRRPWSRSAFAAELELTESRVYVVAERSEVIVGYAGVILAADQAHITTLVVRPEERRRGTGRALLSALLRAARDHGATSATLEVRVGNVAARELYRRAGFAPVGVRAGYYEDTGEDALILHLDQLAGEWG